ncbi:MAG TPA: TlpA disulfide reductase family protein [Sphingomicrobium sp.]|nr:TlpA disulfide reductase family protein [Sphingomicrobium sp.]
MRKRLVPALALTLLAVACNDAPGNSLATVTDSNSPNDPESGQGRALEAGRVLIGKAAPAADLRTIDGQSIDLAEAYGRKPVYLKFWATWCIPCRQQMPGFESDFQEYRDRILTIAVNTGFNDSEDAIRQYRLRHGLSMPIAIDDGSLGEALNLRVTPQHVVIGRSGRVLYVGHEEDAGLRDALERAIAEPPSSVPVARHVQRKGYKVGDMLNHVDPSLEKAAGFELSGSSLDGKARVLMFFSPWCESYLKESRPKQAAACSRVRNQVNQLAKSGGPRFVGISSGLWSSAKDLADYRASKGLVIPVHLDADGRLFRSFGVQEVPTLIVIDATGRVARRIGPTDEDLNVALRAASAG